MAKYVNNLTDEEIENFLKSNGYDLAKNLTDNDGATIDAIERSDSSIFVRARQIENEDFKNKLENLLLEKSPHMMAILTLASQRSAYNNKIDLIHITDYFLTKFIIFPENLESSKELCTAYIKFMMEKFPTYKDDFGSYCDSLKDNEIENE